MFSFLVATLSSSKFRHHCRNGTPTVSTSWIHFQFHLGFLHFCQWWRKAHSPLTNMAFFSYCSGLLRCIQQGSHQSTTIFTTSGNACACVSFRKHGSASGWVYGLVQIEERNKKKNIKKILFILEIVKIRRSPYAHFNFTNLRINTDVLSPMQG